jgi:hypothetical protein
MLYTVTVKAEQFDPELTTGYDIRSDDRGYYLVIYQDGSRSRLEPGDWLITAPCGVTEVISDADFKANYLPLT